MKIKRDVKPQFKDMPSLKVRYNFFIPFIGLVDMVTMAGFYIQQPDGVMPASKVFFALSGLIGLIFTVWSLLWNMKVDGKYIYVNSVIVPKKKIPFSNLKKAVVHRHKKNGNIVFFELVDKNNELIVKIYPLMKDSSLLLERLKRLNYPVEEVKGK